MKKLPPAPFFRLNRAAKLLEIDIDDLLIMAAAESIYLSAYLCGYDGTLHSIASLYRNCSLFPDVKEDCLLLADIITEVEDEKSFKAGVVNHIDCHVLGLWHVNASYILDIAGLDSIDTPARIFSPAHRKRELDVSANYYFFLDYTKHAFHEISVEDLYITRPWVEYIGECMDKNQPIYSPETRINLQALYEDVKNVEHGNRERHRQKREICLLALIYVKRHYPEECKGKNGKETNEAWANATINHWALLGGGYDEPSIDYLKKLIADADRTPEERTTAGKKR